MLNSRDLMRSWLPIFKAIWVVSHVLCLMGCSNLLYYPTRNLYVDPAKVKPVPKDWIFRTPKDLKIQGWVFSAPQPVKGVVLLFHGNGQNRSAHFFLLYWLIERGYDLVVFDYPGYGQTGGTPTPESTVEMAKQALLEVRGAYGNVPLIVYGQSLGGAIAMRAVWEMREKVKPQVLIVDSSFLSYQQVARQILSRSAWTWWMQPLSWVLLSDRWAVGDRLKDLAGLPIVVIHSKTDQIIPFSAGQSVFESALPPKEFWVKESGGHNETYSGPEGTALKERLLQKVRPPVW